MIALLYSTKADEDSSVTLARKGNTAVVIDTTGPRKSLVNEPATAVIGVDSLELMVTTTSGDVSAPVNFALDLDALRAQAMVIPVAGVDAKHLIDSFDDKRAQSRHHNALDIMAARNTPAVAATSGVILKLHNSAAGGLTVYMSDRTGRFVLMYGHLDSYRPGLREGAAVKRGEIIGFVGTTGNASPLAPHLHFQIMRSDNPKEWWKGTALNPFLVYRPTG